jgi:hypothetical protein
MKVIWQEREMRKYKQGKKKVVKDTSGLYF